MSDQRAAGYGETSSAPATTDHPERAAALAPHIRRTMRRSLVEGGFTQIFLNWTSGAVLTGWMLHLGAGPTELGLIASVPFLAQVVSPLAAYLAGLLGHRRLLTATFALVGRGTWVVAASLPLLGIPPEARPAAMVLLVLISSVFQACTSTLWAAWMGDVVPENRRGRYFGFRTGVVGVIGTSANVAAGLFLDRVAAPLSFQVVLGVAVLSAALGIAQYLFHYDPPSPRAPVPLAKVLGSPLRDAGFRRFLRFAVYWNFVVMLAAPFVVPYFLDGLGMTFAQVAVWSALAAVSALGTTVLWGTVADRSGNKAVLQVGTFLAGVAMPAMWILAGWTGNLSFIWASAVFDALAWGGIGPAVFNLSLATAPKGERAAYLAMVGLAGGLAGFLGGLASGPLLVLFTPLAFDVGAVHVTGYHLLFALSGTLRAQGWRLVRSVPEAAAWRTRDVLRAMRTQWRSLGFFWRSG